MASPGAAIQAFCEPVTTTSTPQASIWNGTAPRPDTLSTRMSASGATSRTTAGELGDRVHHPGRGLVVGEQDRLVVAVALELGVELRRIGGVAPLDLDLGDVGAVGPGDLGEPVAERADRHAEDAVARRQGVDHGRLEAARPGGRDHRHVAGRPEVRLHAGQDPAEHGRELGATVVDHLARAGFADGRREGRRAGDAQVGLEAVHGEPPGWCSRSTMRDRGRRGSAGFWHMLSCRAARAPNAPRSRCRRRHAGRSPAVRVGAPRQRIRIDRVSHPRARRPIRAA